MCCVSDWSLASVKMPRRLLVDEEMADQARRILTDAGLGGELRERK